MRILTSSGTHLAVDMLEKGASPYDVAKVPGDAIETVERHYAPFTKELKDRVRRIMENGEGLERGLDTASMHRRENQLITGERKNL
jgi:hypothetical protein